MAHINADGALEILTREKERVRLGSGAGDIKELTPEAMDRGIEALARMRKIADAYNAPIKAVATSAVREANNGDEFVKRARKKAGVQVDVISGVEEARLIRLGVLQAVPVFTKKSLVVDIGGGSTETIIGKKQQILDARSQKLGHIRLTDRFFAGGRIRKTSVADCRDYVRSFLVPVARDINKIGFDVAVGSSGTISAIATLIEVRNGRQPNRWVNNVTFSRGDLDKTIDELTSAITNNQRSKIDGIDPGRADVIVGGAILLEQIFEAFKIKKMTVSSYSLREGVLLDQVRKNQATADGDGLHHLSDLRRDRVLRLARAYNGDLDHVLHATDLSLELFDQTAKVHGLGTVERDYLEAAGMLHNVGLFISHGAHHKHSYYVIRNSDQLVGFTEHELEMIAQVARYHRKSHPKPKHHEFAALRPADQSTIRVLAGLLRLGIALDRSGLGHVADVTVDAGRKVKISPVGQTKTDISLELYTARQRVDLLAEALGRSVEIVG